MSKPILILLLCLLVLISCAKKKTYTPAQTLFVKQAKDYQTRINDYLFHVGSIQWRINGIMGKHNNNQLLYMADPEYRELIKQKDAIIGKSTHNGFYMGGDGSGNDMNINIINIGVDEGEIDGLDLTALRKTQGVVVMKDGGLKKEVGRAVAGVGVGEYQRVDGTGMREKISSEMKGKVG